MFEDLVPCSGGCDKLRDEPNLKAWTCDDCVRATLANAKNPIEELMEWLKVEMEKIQKPPQSSYYPNDCYKEGLVDGYNRVLRRLEKEIGG